MIRGQWGGGALTSHRPRHRPRVAVFVWSDWCRPIAEELLNTLEVARVKWPGRKVTVALVGHSLGGALAVLNTMVLAASPVVDRVTTFTEGCPMILTDDAVEHLQELRQEAVINTVVRKVDGVTDVAGAAAAGAAAAAAAPPPTSSPRPMTRVTVLNVAHCQVRAVGAEHCVHGGMRNSFFPPPPPLGAHPRLGLSRSSCALGTPLCTLRKLAISVCSPSVRFV